MDLSLYSLTSLSKEELTRTEGGSFIKWFILGALALVGVGLAIGGAIGTAAVCLGFFVIADGVETVLD